MWDAFVHRVKTDPDQEFLGQRDYSLEGAPYKWLTNKKVEQMS